MDRVVFSTESVTIGAFRCAASHPLLRNSGPIRDDCFVFPRTTVLIVHDNARTFVADPTIVTLYNHPRIDGEASMTTGKRSRSRSLPAARKDDGTQLKRLRRFCLSIPGTMEKISHGEPTFFTPRRVFAMFANNHHDDGHVAVWLPVGPGMQDAMIEEAPQIYFRPPYVGPSGWIGVELSRVDDDQLGSLIREAFHLTTAKDRGPGSRNTSSPNRSRPPRSSI